MEGAGEGGGVVAIVQALRDAGLAVTVVDARRRPANTGRIAAIKSLNQVPQEIASAETSTEGLKRSDTGAQVCDGRYTSSYQVIYASRHTDGTLRTAELAHCSVLPTSPPVHLPEFPPQRDSPSATQGNFQVGGGGSRETSFAPLRGSVSHRGSDMWIDRGSSLGRSRESAAFARSLRRYPSPSTSPGRSPSAELVQRLLTYTQAKHFTKSSYHTKSTRSLNLKSPLSKDKQTNTRSTKNIQTYTRTRPESTERAANTNNEIKLVGSKSKSRSFKLNWPSMDKKSIKYKDNQLNATYDYLKSTNVKRLPCRGTEVRYLSDVTKCIRDTIRHIYDDRPVACFQVCPNIRSRYSQHKREHHQRHHRAGQQSNSEFNNIECQASLPTLFKEASVMTGCGAPLTSPQPSPTSGQMCCFCKKPRPCACIARPFKIISDFPESIDKCACKRPKDDLITKIDEEIMNWLREIPVYTSETADDKVARQEMIKELEEKLLKLTAEGDFAATKAAIDECVKKLPMWCPDSRDDKDLFKKRIAESLLNKLKSIGDEYGYKELVSHWIDEIPFDDSQIVDKGRIVDSFLHQLKSIKSNVADYKATVKSEIIDMLEKLPISVDGSKSKFINQMAEQLASKLINVDSNEKIVLKEMTDRETDVVNEISNWIKNIPGFSNGSPTEIEDNKNLINQLTYKLIEIQSKGVEDVEMNEQLNDEIRNWLEPVMKNKGVQLDPESKNKLSQNLMKKLMTSPTFLHKQNTRKSNLDDRNYVLRIQDWLEDIPELSDFKNENKLVEKLANKLQDMQSEGASDEVIQEEIEEWLDNLTRKSGVDIDSTSLKNFAQKLTASLKQHKDTNGDMNQTTMHEISELIDNGPIKRSKRKNVKDQISNILSKNIDNVLSNSSDRTQNEIVELLALEANMEENEAEEFDNNIINRVKEKHLPKQARKSIESQSMLTKADIKESIKEEIIDVLDNFKIRINNREELENTIADILVDDILRGADHEKMRADMYSILHDAPVSKEQAENISLELVGRAKEMSLGYKSRDSSSHYYEQSKFNTGKSLDLMDRGAFKDNAGRLVSGFIGEITGESSPKSKKKIQIATNDLIEKLSEIMSDPDHDKENVKKEISHFLRKISIQSNEELVDELTERIQNMDFQTSTPRKERFTFRPRRDTSVLDFSSIHIDDSLSDDKYRYSDEELKYSNELTDIIKLWVNELPIDLNTTEDKGFKKTMIRDLVGDLIDRQKYLQLNPDAKTSDFEELEHLKYQVFRWLNKLPDVNDFTTLMPNTELLMDNLKNVKVPQLVKSHGKRRNTKKSQGGIPNYLDAMEDEISMWINETPNLLTARNVSMSQEIIKALANKIQHLKNIGQDIDEEIKRWLRQATGENNQNKLNMLAQALKDRLKEKGFTDENSWIQTQDKSQFVKENLTGGILDWLKELPLYLERSALEKQMQEDIVVQLANELKRVFEIAQEMPPDVDTNVLFFAEIIKHLKKFPMDSQQKSDESFISRTAQQLLHFLNGLQMFQNISDRRSRRPDEYLDANIEDWLNNLPIIPRKTSAEIRDFHNIKTELKNQIKELRQRNANNDMLLEEITKSLKILPIVIDKQNDEKFLVDKAQELLKTLVAVPIGMNERTPLGDFFDPLLSIESLFGPKQGFKKAADILYENIESWVEGLPIRGGNSPEEQEKIQTIKQNIATKLINKIGEMNLNPEIFNDDFLYDDLLQDEVDNLLSAFSKNSELEKNSEELKQTFLSKVKQVKEKAKSELVGQMYKQQLRDAVPKALPSQGTLSANEQASFEMLKDNVADAFINLHFFGAKEDLRNKFRNKINQEITKFSNDYLKRYPASPVDGRKLNEDLFNALKNVSIPTEESLRNEVEETRMKDEIIDWAKDLPMTSQTGVDQLHTYKIMSILAKRLHDLEKDKEMYTDFEDKLKQVITKWTKKFPLNLEGESKIDDYVNKLVEILKSTEQSRKYSASAVRSVDDLTEDSSSHSHRQSILESQKKTSRPECCKNSSMSQYMPPFPPSTLNTEDLAHLQRIRERTAIPTRFKICPPIRKDASVSPAPIDAESQTEIRPWETCGSIYSGMQQTPSIQIPQITNIPETNQCHQPTSPPHAGVSQTSGSCEPMNQARSQESSTPCAQRSQYEVSPQVIVKEYGQVSTGQSSGYQCSPQPYFRRESSQYQRTPCTQSFTRKPSPCTNISSGKNCTEPQGSTPHTFIPSRHNIEEDAYVTPKRPRTRFEEQPSQACFDQEDEVGTSRSFRKPRVTRLGSLDDIQEPRGRRTMRQDDFEWSSVKFPEDTDFWGSSYPRRHVLPSEDDTHEPYTRERERKEEKVRCRCRERVLTKCAGRRRCPSCQTNDETLRGCSKCCGAQCPHPSYLYFRR